VGRGGKFDIFDHYPSCIPLIMGDMNATFLESDRSSHRSYTYDYHAMMAPTEYQKEKINHNFEETGVPASNKQEHQAQKLQS
jgi:hypothetical protein